MTALCPSLPARGSSGALELETVRVVDEAIEDRIGKGGIADEIVPGFDGELAGNQLGWRGSHADRSWLKIRTI